jgi:hypothetical protein
VADQQIPGQKGGGILMAKISNQLTENSKPAPALSSLHRFDPDLHHADVMFSSICLCET